MLARSTCSFALPDQILGQLLHVAARCCCWFPDVAAHQDADRLRDIVAGLGPAFDDKLAHDQRVLGTGWMIRSFIGGMPSALALSGVIARFGVLASRSGGLLCSVGLSV